jgi:uncharacterized protein (TIGR02145 family)
MCFSCKKEEMHHPVDNLIASNPDRALPYTHTDWMQGMPDMTQLAKITMPGTHDCAADNHSGGIPDGSHWDVCCQDFRFSNQLLMGVRWFDVRYDDVDKRLHHGGFVLSRSLQDFINDAISFLSDHPSETIIFMIKKEYGGSSDGTFSNKVWDILNEYDQNHFYLSDIQPYLWQVRGKIVIATHDNTNPNHLTLGMSFSWPDNTTLHYDTYSNYRYYVQDHYSINWVSYDTKCNNVTDLMNTSYNYPDYGRFDLNFTSAERDGRATSIRTVADNINGNIYSFLLNNIGWRHCGVIMLNYAGGADDGSCCQDLLSMVIQHNDFQSVKIGSQVWMGYDLNVTTYRNGDNIPKVQDAAEWSNLTTGAYCEDEYGKHYNWYAVNDSRGLAPSGWRIPTEADWDYLVDTAGGASIAGQNLKISGSVNWWTAIGKNYTLFTAYPTGFRASNGTFGHYGEMGNWWTATEYNADDAVLFQLYHNANWAKKFNDSKKLGLTVRCINE